MRKLTALFLTVILVTFALSTFSVQAPAAAVAPETTGTLDGRTMKALPTWNTGECGYYREAGLIHRNISDDYCTSEPDEPGYPVNTQPADKTRAERPTVANKPIVVPTVETPAVTVDEQPADKPADKPKSPVVTEQPKPLGNPGNTKAVGHAGENPNGQGTMPLDNAGGNGNGEHGNQGQGGNDNKPNK